MILGLMHMETLAPNLVGDETWREFIRDRVAVLIGLRELPTPTSSEKA